ncbi:MAG: TetR/AcrR family transcriptional regulator [Ignavibacteriales bacterium]|nr:TetR/AcrR family transcriptional regulator [Ignavibacteriales bacterium]
MSDSELRSRILEAASQYFFENGFSKTTMEEFAQSMGMSKKTIYKFFPSKDDIIKEITREKLQHVHHGCLHCQQDKSIDFMQRIKNVTGFISSEMRKLKPQFYSDLQKTMPALWKEVDEFRNQRIYEDFSAMIREGVEIGVFRKDVNIDVLVLMYGNAMQSIINPETLSKLPLNASQAYEAIVDIIFGGVFTQEAKEKYVTHTTEKVTKEEVPQ